MVASVTFALANSIALAGIFLLSDPSGSGRFGEDDDGVGTGLKYFRIPAILKYQPICPAYFDLSVRSTTQSAVISSASSQAGVAAAVGEIAKDNQYQDIVNDNGGDFIPLVCETFGVWSPYALSILGSIADRTTVRNSLPRKFARRQLLQQLSVTLWRYNAKMILRQYSLTAEDEFPDFDIG